MKCTQLIPFLGPRRIVLYKDGALVVDPQNELPMTDGPIGLPLPHTLSRGTCLGHAIVFEWLYFGFIIATRLPDEALDR